MRDAEFEKNVRKSMDELKFSPSNSVWENVELEINTKKKRRYPLIWFFLASGLMSTGYFVVDHYRDTKVNRQSSSQHTVTTASNAANQGHSSQTADNAQSGKFNSNLNARREVNPPKVVNSDLSLGAPQANQSKLSSGSIGRVSKINRSRLASRITNKGENLISAEPGITSQNKSISSPSAHAPVENPAKSDNKDMASGNGTSNTASPTFDNGIRAGGSSSSKTSGSETEKPEVAPTTNKSSATKKDSSLTKVELLADVSKPKNIEQNQKKSPLASTTGKWKYGFQISPALSAFQRSLWHPSTANAAIPAAASSSYYAAVMVNGRSVGPTYFGGVQSTIKPGFAFSAGGFVQRLLNNRISVTAGLNYYFVTTHIETGGKVNSSLSFSVNNNVLASASAYYLSGNSHNYTNHFHFLELPINVRLQLNRSVTVPVYWETGISVSRLLATDALQYSDLSGVYYKSDNFYNKTQFNWQTALMLGFSEKKTLFTVGPMVQYGISNLTRSGSGGSPQHTFISGIKITITPGFR